jgi:hypothetical protein
MTKSFSPKLRTDQAVFLPFPRSFSWGIGGAATKGFWGTCVSPHACSHKKHYPKPKIKMNQTKGQNMQKTKIKSAQNQKQNLTPRLTSALLILTTLLTLSCTTTLPRENKTTELLNAENNLIEKLTVARNDPKIAQKIQSDSTLSRAEIELNEVLDAIKEANQEVAKTVGK